MSRKKKKGLSSKLKSRIDRVHESTKEREKLSFAIAEDLPNFSEFLSAVEQKHAEHLEDCMSILNELPIGMLSIDINGNIRAVNSFLLNILGSPSEDEIKKINALKFTPLISSGISELFKKCMDTASVVSGEYSYRSKWGKYTELEIRSSPNINNEGKIIGCTSVLEDVSKRKKAHEEVKTQFQLIETLLNNIPCPIYYKNKSGIYMSCNDAFANDILGFRKEQIIGKSLYDFPDTVDPELISAHQRFDREVMAHVDTQKYETHVKKADGEVGEFIFNKAAIKDAEKNIIGIAGIMLDVTNYKKAEKELIKKSALFEGLLESLPEMVFFKDLHRNYLGCNPAFSEYAGIPVDEIIGKNDHELFDKETADLLRENDRSALGYGNCCKNEYWVTYPDGRRVLLETYKAPLHTTKGKLIGTLGISHDITAHKLAESELIQAKVAAETSNRAKSDFIANVSHELRTPLNAIIGFSEILEDQSFGPLNDNQSKYVSHVLSSSRHLLNIINNILDISKIENDDVGLYYEAIDINSSAEEAINVLGPVAYEKGIELKSSLFSDPLTIEADRNKIIQILYNLIGNAIKFTPQKGYVKVELTKMDDLVQLLVQDSGIGIPDDKMEEIFLPFTQLDCKTNRKYAGTGLGLALVQKFTEMHGGSIEIDSGLSKGSTFLVNIPIRRNGPFN